MSQVNMSMIFGMCGKCKKLYISKLDVAICIQNLSHMMKTGYGKIEFD